MGRGGVGGVVEGVFGGWEVEEEVDRGEEGEEDLWGERRGG